MVDEEKETCYNCGSKEEPYPRYERMIDGIIDGSTLDYVCPNCGYDGNRLRVKSFPRGCNCLGVFHDYTEWIDVEVL